MFEYTYVFINRPNSAVGKSFASIPGGRGFESGWLHLVTEESWRQLSGSPSLNLVHRTHRARENPEVVDSVKTHTRAGSNPPSPGH